MFGITNSDFQKHLRCIFKAELVLKACIKKNAADEYLIWAQIYRILSVALTFLPT